MNNCIPYSEFQNWESRPNKYGCEILIMVEFHENFPWNSTVTISGSQF